MVAGLVQRDGNRAWAGAITVVGWMVIGMGVSLATRTPAVADSLARVASGAVDITPDLAGGTPVWIAGYGMGRRATGVHDPLFARCLVVDDGSTKVALVSVDLVGLQFPEVLRIRERLTEFQYVLVSSTHNHEGPDVIGIWGRSPIHRGVDDAYLDQVVEKVVELCRQTARRLAPVTAEFGTATDESLLRDSREPQVKDGILRTLTLTGADGRKSGLLVDWSSHPESMGSKNSLLTADFPAATIGWLERKYQCPITYFSGAVGGLMTPPRNRIRDDNGQYLNEGDFTFMERYGQAVGELAARAVEEGSSAVRLHPIQIASQRVYLPVENALYRAARGLNVLVREATIWSGDPAQKGAPLSLENADQTMAIETEVACVRLGDVYLACIPGEIYPELLYGQFQDPVDPNVDYPDAPLEPHLDKILAGKKWMLIGLANDEVGYIIPLCQWDKVPPFAYGRKESQYGEVNSCGSQVAPILMQALRQCAMKLESAR
ncbi:MAG: hypothetical protein FJ295_17245 [Planctomycetes bacterium]|nr:hypothetical protein [Planctomycetota bacterium]